LRQLRQWLRHSILSIAMVGLIAGYSVTLWAWYSANNNVNKSVQLKSEQLADNLQSEVEKRLTSYQEILRGSETLFTLNDNAVSGEQWKTYVNTYRLPELYPGLQAIGYIESVPAANVANHEEKMRSSGVSNYHINPAYPRSMYYPVVYAEPANLSAVIGYDMATDARRQEAMESARDSGEAKISDVVELRGSKKPGFLIYYPLYRTSAHTTSERQTQHIGYAYGSVRVEELFRAITEDQFSSPGEFGVLEGAALDQKYIYKTTNFDRSAHSIHQKTIYIFGKKWTIESSLSSDVLSAQEKDQPNIILATGLLLSTLFGLFILYATQSRSREINYRKQLELQDAKDELLSLASHQLRTPATGVKQYIGMLLEGYIGTVPKKQRDILSKAYQSNERQLEIVNQILHIARIEAGRLPIDKQFFDFSNLVKQIASEQKPAFRERKQKISTSIPKRPLVIEGDQQYLAMVIENLLTNASKYTHEKGTINLKVSASNDLAVLEVKDSGVGIALEDMDKLFQKFSRIDNELSVSSGGTGIGLYLAKLIVELHNGTVDVTSTPGKGSTFRVKLPLKAV
jgi:signal transduction histidine kinase